MTNYWSIFAESYRSCRNILEMFNDTISNGILRLKGMLGNWCDITQDNKAIVVNQIHCETINQLYQHSKCFKAIKHNVGTVKQSVSINSNIANALGSTQCNIWTDIYHFYRRDIIRSRILSFAYSTRIISNIHKNNIPFKQTGRSETNEKV